MNPKTLLITTVLGSIVATASFGAASLRAPQMGGTSTVAAPTATNTARAGTLRTQTMKTSSVSTPSVTTAQSSIATPVSTETTDARIALLKGIKGFNPGKVKNTTTATNELNSLNDRIEELTAQLDRAEAAQSNVITEANIDAKIDQKLSALGASTSTKETYSKTEINTLLTALERKLPQIDDRGNINMIDTNGTTVSYSIWQPTGEHSWGPVNESLYYFVSLPNNQQSVEKIIAFARNKCNNWDVSPHESFVCGSDNIRFVVDDPQFGTGYRFSVLNHFKGWGETQGYPEIIHQNGQVIYRNTIQTYEYSTLATLKTAVCGETSSDWCDVYSFWEVGTDGLGTLYQATMERRLREGLSDNEKPTIDDRGNINMIDPNGSLISWSLFEYQYTDTTSILLRNTMYYTTTLPNTEQSLEKIRNWARNKCTEANSSQGVFSCALGYAEYDALSAKWYLAVNIDFKGYAQYQDPDVIYAQNAFTFRKYLQSFEYDTEEKFRTAACGNSSADECTVHSFDEFTVYGAHNAYRATVDYTYATKNNE
ncbi:MAG: hypothetical protein IJL21_04760 [Alphaproteobacteria bacterium]|nr:hypothetical protein [Alphaproteobacteria bacterium]